MRYRLQGTGYRAMKPDCQTITYLAHLHICHPIIAKPELKTPVTGNPVTFNSLETTFANKQLKFAAL
ncbi:hypothetical protein A4R26_10045 [Niastella populi]|uniref:Uncharacterized protein n=1 Tax=Niastella populi TaxID=550983 RepID=A0A1V9EIV4_9BACT|nr:hypothetical protein A4R26_10045 [Niastella populi]